MEENKTTVKSVFKGIGSMILTLIVAFLLLLAGQELGKVMVKPMLNSDNSAIVFAGFYAAFIGIWVILLLATLIRKKNRVDFEKLKMHKSKIGISFTLGLICGIGMNLLVAIVAMLHGDIHLQFGGFNLVYFLLFIVCVTIQSGAEELTCRWFIYNRVLRAFPKWPVIAIISNAALFSALHLGNPGVTAMSLLNIMIVGLLYSLMVYYYDSFWGAVIAHTSWNFCQNILLGLPNSGIVSVYSVFQLDGSPIRGSFAYHTDFGIEGTILTNVLLMLCCVGVIYFGRKKKLAEAQVAAEAAE